MIKWGIIGCGKIAGKFAEDFHKVEGCELYGVASRSIDKAIRFAKVNKAHKAFGSYEELAADENIDVVYIATPHPYHKDNTILCLENKKHVLCEKPFAMNAGEVNEMVNAAKANDRFLMEAIWTQFFPYMKKLKEIISNGEIGDIKMIEADFGFHAKFDASSRLFDPDLGGGALLDIGIYPLFLCHTLLGKPDEISSHATIGKTGVDESTTMNLKWRSGAMASLNCTILADTKTVAKIYGPDKYIEINSRWHESKSMSINDKNGQLEVFTFDDDYRGYAYEIMEVNRCISHKNRESDRLSLDFSRKLIESMDIIRSQIKLTYSSDH